MRKRLTLLATLSALLLTACGGGGEQTPAADAPDFRMEGETHFGAIRMLTETGENAEAYWGFTEERLVYQATFGDMGCDQIFVMNRDGSDRRMVSTGKGRTTCAFFLPGDTLVVYASTHLADSACPPPPDR